MNRISGWVLLLALLAVVSCAVKPEPIIFGEDHCTYCMMSIADPKFGAELVTEKGKVFKFDAIECMVPYFQENSDVAYSHILGIAYDEPGELKPVDQLNFVFSEEFTSPMGADLASFNRSVALEDHQRPLDWQQIKTHIFSNH